MQLIVKDDKLQKFRDHIQTGTELGEAKKKYFDRYFFAFTLLVDGTSKRKLIESLMHSPPPIGGLSQSIVRFPEFEASISNRHSSSPKSSC